MLRLPLRDKNSPIVSSRHRLIVGVDYGTTYSGISFVTTDKSTAEAINVIRAWPGKDGEWKTPTRIAYADENERFGLRENAWGFQVEPNQTSCSWTKLLLNASTEDNRNRSGPNRNTGDTSMQRLPPGMDAKQVCEDFLRELYKHMMADISKRLPVGVLQATPMDCWLTVPAVWSDKAQNATQAAAKAAGFGSRAGDTISVISEPEAAAITVLKKYTQPDSINALRAGQDVLICDCGGGTVDITTYTIMETSPRLEFEEVVVGTGETCGSTFVDRNLHELMRQRFGKAFEDVEPRRKGPGSRFMNQWESVKRSFGQSGSYLTKEIGPLIMRGVESSHWYDEDDGSVKLTSQDVEALFEPVVNDIVRLVSDQADEVKTKGRLVDRLVLVGGFGDSQYLYSKLDEWCKSNGISQAECPEHPQAAIVRGAALRGLEGVAPRARRCRRHYGVALNRPFREGVDPAAKAFVDRWTGKKYCHDRVDWLISKGDSVAKDTARWIDLRIACERDESAFTESRLISTTLEHPPEYTDDPRVEKVGTIQTDFTKVDKSDFASHRAGLFGTKVWNFGFQLQVSFGSQAGVLEFKTFISGSLSGSASITFD